MMHQEPIAPAGTVAKPAFQLCNPSTGCALTKREAAKAWILDWRRTHPRSWPTIGVVRAGLDRLNQDFSRDTIQLALIEAGKPTSDKRKNNVRDRTPN